MQIVEFAQKSISAKNETKDLPVLSLTLLTKFTAVVVLLSLGPLAFASEKKTPVSFWKDVRPVLQVHCQGCHQPAKKGGDYLLTSYQAMMGPGESDEQPIVPGDAANSYLFQQIDPSGGVAEMPQGKPPLTMATVELIRRWILEGAKDDSPKLDISAAKSGSPKFYATVPPITAMDVSADQRLMAVSGYHEVIVHDLSRLRETGDASTSIVGRLAGVSERIESICFSPNGKRLAVAGGSPGRLGEIQIWSLRENKLLFSQAGWHDCCFGVSWSPNGELVAFGCPDNSIQVIDATTGTTVFANRSHSDWVLGTAFSMNSQKVVSVSRDRTMKLFDVAAKRFVTNLARFEATNSKIGIQAISHHPQRNEYLIGGTDRIARIYRGESNDDGKISDESNLVQKFGAVPGRIFGVKFSIDGQRVIIAGDQHRKGFVYEFHVDSPKKGKPMKNVEGGIFAAAFLDDDTTIASAGFESTVYLNDAKTGESLGNLDPFPRRR